jgi:hypothetical protein
MLSVPSGSKNIREGLSDDEPIVFESVKSIDFENLLWMFYNQLCCSDSTFIQEAGVLI